MSDDDSLNPSEVSDLQTAKIALHGALSMLRTVQDINQRLKGEIQDAQSREKIAIQHEQEAQLARARTEAELLQLRSQGSSPDPALKERLQLSLEREMQLKYQEQLDQLKLARDQKNKELYQVREQLIKKSQALDHLTEQSAAAVLRSQTDWSAALSRVDDQYHARLEKAYKTQAEELEDLTAARVNTLKERCQDLENQLVAQAHELTEEFHQRIEHVLQQAKLREQTYWTETTQLRAAMRHEFEQLANQRVVVVQEQHRAALAELEARQRDQAIQIENEKQRLAQDFKQKEEQMRLQFEERLQARDQEFKIAVTAIQTQAAVQLQHLRQERQEALDAAQAAQHHPEQFFRREQEAFRAQTIAEFSAREQKLNEHFLASQKDAETRHMQALSVLHDRAAQEREAQVNAAQQQIRQLQTAGAEQRTQMQALRGHLEKADQERRQADEKMLALELSLTRSQNEADSALHAALQLRDEAHRVATQRLHEEMQAISAEKIELTAAVNREAALAREFQKALAHHQQVFEQRFRELSAAARHPEPDLQVLVDEWIFGFAHQIRNPLAIIRSTAEAFADLKMSKTEHAETSSAIVQSVDMLTERLAQFKEFSKSMSPATTTIALGPAVVKSLTALKSRFTQRGIRAQFASDPDVPQVRGRADQFESAFTALLLNALEAMPAGGTLDIQVRQDAAANQQRIILKDSGSGIRPQHASEVGKPFFTTKPAHVGLGLAHVKRVLHLYGGSLGIENDPAGGVIVTCILPTSGFES